MSHFHAVTCQNPRCKRRLGRYRKQTGKLTKAHNVQRVYDTNEPQTSTLICPACGTVRTWRDAPKEAESMAA